MPIMFHQFWLLLLNLKMQLLQQQPGGLIHMPPPAGPVACWRLDGCKIASADHSGAPPIGRADHSGAPPIAGADQSGAPMLLNLRLPN